MVNCFRCKKEFGIKWVPARKAFSQKNNWEYWTGKFKEKDIKDKQMCDNCLINFYKNEKALFFEEVKEEKKRSRLGSYISYGDIRPS